MLVLQFCSKIIIICALLTFIFLQACETEGHKHHILLKLKKHGLLEEGKKHTPEDISKHLASLHIYQRYFHRNQTAGDTLDDDDADAHFMHYK